VRSVGKDARDFLKIVLMEVVRNHLTRKMGDSLSTRKYRLSWWVMVNWVSFIEAFEGILSALSVLSDEMFSNHSCSRSGCSCKG
jgi:hypothetical protein